MLKDIMNDHDLEQSVCTFLIEKNIVRDYHISPWPVSRYPVTGQTL